jgi:hypothetical protein
MQPKSLPTQTLAQIARPHALVEKFHKKDLIDESNSQSLTDCQFPKTRGRSDLGEYDTPRNTLTALPCKDAHA